MQTTTLNSSAAAQDDDTNLLADMGVLSMPRPSHQADASKASVAQQTPASVPGFSAESALQPLSISVGCSSYVTDIVVHSEAA